jgi:hypothetical protein
MADPFGQIYPESTPGANFIEGERAGGFYCQVFKTNGREIVSLSRKWKSWNERCRVSYNPATLFREVDGYRLYL